MSRCRRKRERGEGRRTGGREEGNFILKNTAITNLALPVQDLVLHAFDLEDLVELVLTQHGGRATPGIATTICDKGGDRKLDVSGITGVSQEALQLYA